MTDQSQTEREIPQSTRVPKGRRSLAVVLGISMVIASFNFVPRRDVRRFMTARGSSIVEDHAASPHNVSLLSAGFEYRRAATTEDEEEAPSVLTHSRGLAYSWPTFNNMTEAECGQESIDALRVPTFIVPGAQKAGTSAIYKLLNMHPHVVSSRKFEVHFFDYQLSKMGKKNPATVSDEDICERRRAYQKHFDVAKVQRYDESGEEARIATFEKSPRYLAYPHIPGFVKRITPWTKVLVTLRNPIDRAYSQYKMDFVAFSKKPNFPSFEQAVNDEIKKLRAAGQSIAPTLDEYLSAPSTYSDENFALPANQGLTERKMELGDFSKASATKKRALQLKYLSRGFYAQQLSFWFDYFELDNDLKIIQYEKFKGDEPKVFREILEFIGVDPDAWDMNDEIFEKDFRPSKKVEKKMDTTTRDYLEKLYKPYNDELVYLLGEEWSGVWV